MADWVAAFITKGVDLANALSRMALSMFLAGTEPPLLLVEVAECRRLFGWCWLRYPNGPALGGDAGF